MPPDKEGEKRREISKSVSNCTVVYRKGKLGVGKGQHPRLAISILQLSRRKIRPRCRYVKGKTKEDTNVKCYTS